MAEESDGMNDAVEGHLRIGVTLGMRAAEVLAQVVAERAREGATSSQDQARQLTARLDAERSAARASVEAVGSEQWWARAQPEQITSAWQTTQAWKDVDPGLARKGEEIAAQLQARYGIDVEHTQPEPQALREAMAAREGQDPAAKLGPTARREALEAGLLVGEADAADRGRRSEPAPSAEKSGAVAYDSDARREAKGVRLSKAVDPETARAVMLADLAQGKPAREAVTTKTSLGSQARPPRLAQDLASEQVKMMGR